MNLSDDCDLTYREAYAVAVAALRVRASELSPEENR